MSEYAVVRQLRPYLFTSFRRFYQPCQLRRSIAQLPQSLKSKGNDVTHDYEKRVDQLKAIGPERSWYPRLNAEFASSRLPIYQFHQQYGHLLPEESNVEKTVTVAGKIRSVRTAGGKLVFIDLEDNGCRAQVVCSYNRAAQANDQMTLPHFKQFAKLARKGDAFMATGNPHRTHSGELSVLATSLPTLLSPSLHQIPEKLEDAEALVRNRHVDMLVNDAAKATLVAQHHVEATMQAFFNELRYTKVNTPILNSVAGGATARPFETKSTELAGEQLHLRIAPELWLKRLVVGGLEKVYEIGPAFRNEGVDQTHNPEFNICEFYEAYATLDDLKQRTQALFRSLSEAFQSLRNSDNPSTRTLPEPDPSLSQPFAVLEFIPELESLLNSPLPNLEDEDSATTQILTILRDRKIEIPSNPTLPRLLDTLSSTYLEPLTSSQPTFITNHPACMSPLSKHFLCPRTSQTVAARAELFYKGREYANMYEEENSPFEQRRKFEAQMRDRALDPEAMVLDEAYLKALEWGLPPTGGWGCGVDRIVMLFAGRERMADVLAFGSLRNVVGLGKVGRRA